LDAPKGVEMNDTVKVLITGGGGLLDIILRISFPREQTTMFTIADNLSGEGQTLNFKS
jgi:hypothetical protein